MRDSLKGPGARTEGRPPEDESRPGVVRDLTAVTRDSGEVLLRYRAPERIGNTTTGKILSRMEYRFALGKKVGVDVAWQEAPLHLLSHRFIIVRDLEGGETYTFEVRAVYGEEKAGPAASAQAKPCCDASTVQPPPTPTPPSEPLSIGATAGEVYTELVSVGVGAESRPARRAFVDVTVKWNAAAEQGNAVVDYEFRWSEGGSVPSSVPWQAGLFYAKDDLSFTATRLKPNTRYTFEVRTVSSHGASAGSARRQLTTLRFTGPHYTVSAPDSVREGQTLTVTVSRTNRTEGVSTVLVQIVDDDRSGEEPFERRVVGADLASTDSRATITYTVADDGKNTNDRKVKVRIGEVVGTGANRALNTFSVEWHSGSVTDTTP